MYKAKSIDFDGILGEVISRTKFLEDPKRLLEFIKEDSAAIIAKILEEIGIDLKRIINDLYIKKEVIPPVEELEESISEERPEEVEEEREIILSNEEIKYLQEVFSRHVLTVAGLLEREVSKIVEALSDEEHLSTKGIEKSLADRLLPLLSSPVVKAVSKLSKSDVAKIRELLARQGAERHKTKEEKEGHPGPKVKQIPVPTPTDQIIDYNTFIDVVIDKSRMTKEIILETIGYDSELVYEIMTKLLLISPEKIGRDLLSLRTKEQIEGYIDDTLGQLTEDNFGDLLRILKPRHEMIYGLMDRLKIDLKSALESLCSKNRKDYDPFVNTLFNLYGHMLRQDTLCEIVFKDPIVASGIINQCDLKHEELIEIIKAHDGIILEMENLFINYKLDYEPFQRIRYGEIPEAVEGLRREIQEKLKEDEKVEFLYGLYDIGLNYELEAKKYNTCAVIAQYANKSAANPYEIALRLGDKLEIPLPPNFLRDIALALAMSLKRSGLVSQERFDELLQKADQYRQKEGYYE